VPAFSVLFFLDRFRLNLVHVRLSSSSSSSSSASSSATTFFASIFLDLLRSSSICFDLLPRLDLLLLRLDLLRSSSPSRRSSSIFFDLLRSSSIFYSFASIFFDLLLLRLDLLLLRLDLLRSLSPFCVNERQSDSGNGPRGVRPWTPRESRRAKATVRHGVEGYVPYRHGGRPRSRGGGAPTGWGWGWRGLAAGAAGGASNHDARTIVPAMAPRRGRRAVQGRKWYACMHVGPYTSVQP